MLTIELVGRRAGWCDRTARTYVAAWFDAWATHRERRRRGEPSRPPRVPRVRRVRTGGRGRPRYAVDARSFDAWLGIPANTDAAANQPS